MDQLLDAFQRIAQDPSRNAPAVAAGVSIVVLSVILVVLVLIAFALPKTKGSAQKTARMPRFSLPRWLYLSFALVLAAAGVAGAVALWYHGTSTDAYCTSTCHSMAVPTESWALSSHSNVSCVRCHEGRPWESFARGVVMRSNSLYLELTSAPPRGERVPPENCMSCHANVIEKPLKARNGEVFLHGEVLTVDPSCTRCHGPQGHEPRRP